MELTSEDPPLQSACARLALLSPCFASISPPPLPTSLRNPKLGLSSLTAPADNDLSYSDATSIIPHTSKTGFFARPIQTIHIKPSKFFPLHLHQSSWGLMRVGGVTISVLLVCCSFCSFYLFIGFFFVLKPTATLPGKRKNLILMDAHFPLTLTFITF
ncbi:hypothetical protein EDD16DRAFT_1173021 [Pisolithus croceorrhizus]|nr:hypothetical protein EDD16DRAFT_1173021 [Pisolithus croceorrhizus]KAI6125947.1 hypothetical protein EV401DRAFT_1038719 [Pisolithus croceorrhizus]